MTVDDLRKALLRPVTVQLDRQSITKIMWEQLKSETFGFKQFDLDRSLTGELFKYKLMAIYDQMNTIEAKCIHCDLPRSMMRSFYAKALSDNDIEIPESKRVQIKSGNDVYACSFCIVSGIDHFWTDYKIFDQITTLEIGDERLRKQLESMDLFGNVSAIFTFHLDDTHIDDYLIYRYADIGSAFSVTLIQEIVGKPIVLDEIGQKSLDDFF